jgi:hypothetical protein
VALESTPCFPLEPQPLPSSNLYQNAMVAYWMRMAAVDAGMMACMLLAACRSLSSLDDPNDSSRSGRGHSYATLSIRYSIQALESLKKAVAQPGQVASDETIVKSMAIASDAVCLARPHPAWMALWAHLRTLLRPLFRTRSSIATSTPP